MTAQFICRTQAPSERLKTDRSRPRPSRRGLQTSGSGCRSACARSLATGPNESELQQEPVSEPDLVPATAPDSTAVRRMLASVGMEKASGSSAGSATSSSVLDSVTSREISSSRKLPKLGGGPILYSILSCRSLAGHRGRLRGSAIARASQDFAASFSNLRRSSDMLYAILGPLAFNVGSSVLSPGSAIVRAPLASMSAVDARLEGDFVYGKPVPASQGIPGFSGPKSFTPEMTGVVVPTNMGESSEAPAPRAPSAALEGEFVYGAPVPASKGIPGFAVPKSFTAGEVGLAVNNAPIRPGQSAALAGDLVYGAPVPASKGIPGFAVPKSFTAGEVGLAVNNAPIREGQSAALAGDLVYGAPVPASRGVPGFAGPKSFYIEP